MKPTFDKRCFDKKYNFLEVFNSKTGFYARSGVLNPNGDDTGIDPFMRNFPSLLDVGIMGNCKNASLCSVGCYQGKKVRPNMTLDDFKSIVDQAVKGKTFEMALGGFGSPNEHPDFIEILKYTRENGIVPNYTTSGIELTESQIWATKEFCGAVAVSFYRQPYTINAIERFIAAGVKTNIHYVLGNDSIDEAIFRLENNYFPKGVNAVAFLMYKPVGCIKKSNVLKIDDPRVACFYKTIDKGGFSFKVVLDACHLPAVSNFSKKINPICMTPCDGGSFSAYITPDMVMLPCSFDSLTRKYGVSLRENTMVEVWNSPQFETFRNYHRNSCSGCPVQNDCRGGCPLAKEINLCDKKEKDFYEN
jgi:radical SAM protein with 4Fe4S-binding SPASM domain